MQHIFRHLVPRLLGGVLASRAPSTQSRAYNHAHVAPEPFIASIGALI